MQSVELKMNLQNNILKEYKTEYRARNESAEIHKE